jgi:hypothetical protein
MQPGDGVAIQTVDGIEFAQKGDAPVKALLFDLP